MQNILQEIYVRIRYFFTSFIRPCALFVKEFTHIHRGRRRNRRERIFSSILSYEIQGEKVVNVPNVLSLSRPFLAWIIGDMFSYGVPWYSILFVLCVMIITDIADGAWAEIDAKTSFGAFIDPVCDKFAFGIFVYKVYGGSFPIELAILLFIDFILLIVGIYGFLQGNNNKEQADFRSNIFGKTKFFFQSAGLFFLCINMFYTASIFFIISIPFALLSLILKVYTLAKP